VDRNAAQLISIAVDHVGRGNAQKPKPALPIRM
jgi:hypothetical protein